MIRNNPMHDTDNPPGQIRYPRYLRDIIARIEGEEDYRPQERTEGTQATTPLVTPEKRLEALFKALEEACMQSERSSGRILGSVVPVDTIRYIVENVKQL